MGKMMSILEKYKFVEKEASLVNEEISPSCTSEEELELLPETEDNSTTKIQELIEEPPTMQNPVFTENTQATTHTQPLTIKEIYAAYQLDSTAITDSVYLLENLIHALPEELPDFVKKTTVNNIVQASAMDIDKLLKDGYTRAAKLKEFMEEYTTAHLNDIEKLKQEIDHLNTLITQCHQQVRSKEKLIQEETALVETEETRIHTILNFFKS